VVRELLRALAARGDDHEYRCYARGRWDANLDDRFLWQLNRSADPLWHLRVAAHASRGCDVFLSTNSYLTVPLLGVPAVAIVYDLVTFDPALVPNRRSSWIEHLTLPPAARRAARLICISDATARALTERYPNVRDKVVVTPLGVSPDLAAPSSESFEDLPAPGFLLAVGTIEPRKNLQRLVAAYASLPPALRHGHQLVVVGPPGWETGPILDALTSLGDECAVIGRVSDAVLAELYRRCGAFCYPSLGEGFGLPVLEAMAAGAPVITSDVSSLPEVGGDAVEYVSPLSVESIAAGIERVLGSPQRRAELSTLGPQRAEMFTWERMADVLVTALTQSARISRH
jgi:glycosyltransferase involved in cell wall biosynthesis